MKSSNFLDQIQFKKILFPKKDFIKKMIELENYRATWFGCSTQNKKSIWRVTSTTVDTTLSFEVLRANQPQKPHHPKRFGKWN